VAAEKKNTMETAYCALSGHRFKKGTLNAVETPANDCHPKILLVV